MEEVTPNEEFVTRSVSIREDSTTRLTRRVLLTDPPPVKDRLGVQGRALTYRDRERYNHTPYRCTETRKNYPPM